MIHYDSDRVEQEELGKTNLPVSFWTASQQEAYMPKPKKKKKKFFDSFYNFTAELSMAYKLQIPSLSAKFFLLLFLLNFFYFSSMSSLTNGFGFNMRVWM